MNAIDILTVSLHSLMSLLKKRQQSRDEKNYFQSNLMTAAAATIMYLLHKASNFTLSRLGNGRLFRAALRENFGCWFRRKIFEELSMPKANFKSNNNEPFVMSCFFNSFVSHLLLQYYKATDFSRLRTSQEPLCEDGISFKSSKQKISSTERKIEI
jgi:hypothetical protein